MADPQHSGTRSRTTTSTTTRWGRRTAVGPWLGAAVVAPLALAGIATGVQHHSIEKRLTERSQAALSAHGVDGVDVSFSGRDGTLSVPAGVDADRAKKLVEDVDGVRTAKVSGGSADGSGGAATATDSASASASDSASDSASASASDSASAMASDSASAAGAGASDTAAAGTGAKKGRKHRTAGAAGGDTSGCATAASDVTAALAGHKLEFAESSPQLTAASLTTLGQVANILKHCSTATVKIAGYTDNQGDPSTDIPLSTARAHAVEQVLVRDGVSASSITAKGYGEADPIASNSTAEGRAQNRRVEITVG